MPIKIKFPNSLVTKSGRTFLIISPNQIDKKETTREIINNIILAKNEILVFLIPYVMPIPRASILLESAKTSELTNIIKTPP